MGKRVGPIERIADFVLVLQAHAKKLGVKKGEWITGYGYDRSNLAEGRELLASELDPAFPDNPVMLIHSSNMWAIPGAMDAEIDSRLFWGSLDVSLAVAGVVAFQPNRWRIARGRGHALAHAHHRGSKREYWSGGKSYGCLGENDSLL